MAIFLSGIWSNSNASFGTQGLEFNFQTAQTVAVFLTALHRCDIFLQKAVLPGRNDAEVSLQLSTGFGVI